MNCEYTYFCRNCLHYNRLEITKMNANKTLFSLLLFFLMLTPSISHAQVSPSDSSVFAPLVQTSYQAQFPAGDMEDRYGFHSQLGIEFHIKTRSNFFIGTKGGFIFGSQVNETGLLDNISTDDESDESAFVISQSGARAEVFADMRGFSAYLTGGKLFTVLSPNPNSGILVQGGIGFIQHKIRYHWSDFSIPHLEGEYQKGYDLLSSGPATNFQLGYLFLGNERLINFYGGFDLTYAQTQNRRGYNYKTMGPDNEVKEDLIYSIKFSWILPLYKPAPKEYYYY